MTMNNNFTKENNTERKEDMYMITTSTKNTFSITVQVNNPEALVGKTYKEIAKTFTDMVVRNAIHVDGPFVTEPGKFYDINTNGIVKDVDIDSIDGIHVRLDTPFIETKNPTPNSIMGVKEPEEEDDFEEDIINEFIDKLGEYHNFGNFINMFRDTMPNGYDLYLTDNRFKHNQIVYVPENKCYLATGNDGRKYTVTIDDVNKSRICFISSSEEFIPAFYISLDYSWYERYGIFVPTPDLN